MKRRKMMALGMSTLAATLCAEDKEPAGLTGGTRVVRLAELEIDPAQLAPYAAALAEEIDASLRTEPGVLSLNAVALKDDPTQIRIFEVYANAEAYNEHIESPHFKRYKAATQGMVKSLKLHEADPIRIAACK